MYLNSIFASSRIIGSPSWKVSCELYCDSSGVASSTCITWLSSFVRNWVKSTVCSCVFWCVLLWSTNICSDVNWLLHLPHWNISSSSWSIAVEKISTSIIILIIYMIKEYWNIMHEKKMFSDICFALICTWLLNFGYQGLWLQQGLHRGAV